jgi:hypothetical protein
MIKNGLDRPLIVLIDRVPWGWLGAGESRSVYLRKAELRISAREFFGQLLFAERTVATPGEVLFSLSGVSVPAPPGE